MKRERCVLILQRYGQSRIIPHPIQPSLIPLCSSPTFSFVATQNWQLAWYGGQGTTSAYKIKLDPTDPNFSSWSGTLVGVADFSNNSDGHPIVVKLETNTNADYFIGFNRATGANSQNDEGDDQVTVIQVTGGNGLGYSQSFLRARLTQGGTYTIENFPNAGGATLSIRADAINIGTNPGLAQVTVSMVGRAPTAAPTINRWSNVALSKPASQSSTGWGGIASRGVDGNISGQWGQGGISHTNSESNPWWKVDLQDLHEISSMKVFNREDCCSDRLSNFKVTVLNGSSEVWSYTHNGIPTYETDIAVAGVVIGDTVQVSLAGNNRILSLAEVQVWSPNDVAPTTSAPTVPPAPTLSPTESPTETPTNGPTRSPTRPTPSPTITPTKTPITSAPTRAGNVNVARGKSASQSTTGWGGSASRGVDGNISGQWSRSGITHTNTQSNPWWKVDLQSSYDISKITVYNRQDCCSERLANFKVTIFDGTSEAWSHTHSGTPSYKTDISVPEIAGNMVQVSLAGNARILSLAEVEVYGQ